MFANNSQELAARDFFVTLEASNYVRWVRAQM
jgi:hypothetical protein